MREIRLIVIHCADTPASMDIGAEEIRRWHVEERGFSDIGYHYVIRRDGGIEDGRDLDNDGDVDEEVGAHALGHNKYSIGICMVGGKGGSNFTRQQWASLDALIRNLKNKYSDAEVVGHRDLDSSKACPSFDAVSWWNGHIS